MTAGHGRPTTLDSVQKILHLPPGHRAKTVPERPTSLKTLTVLCEPFDTYHVKQINLRHPFAASNPDLVAQRTCPTVSEPGMATVFKLTSKKRVTLDSADGVIKIFEDTRNSKAPQQKIQGVEALNQEHSSGNQFFLVRVTTQGGPIGWTAVFH
jgi:hypothetical protein